VRECEGEGQRGGSTGRIAHGAVPVRRCAADTVTTLPAADGSDGTQALSME